MDLNIHQIFTGLLSSFLQAWVTNFDQDLQRLQMVRCFSTELSRVSSSQGIRSVSAGLFRKSFRVFSFAGVFCLRGTSSARDFFQQGSSCDKDLLLARDLFLHLTLLTGRYLYHGRVRVLRDMPIITGSVHAKKLHLKARYSYKLHN